MGVQLDAGGGDKKVKPNINVTPLVDVVLVLLIIFMLVIPNMQEGVAVELFKAKNAEKDADDAEPVVVSVALGDDPDEVTYHIGEDQVTRDALVATLQELHAADPSQHLLFRGDSRIPYGKIRDVFHECQNVGFAYIQLSVGAQKESWEEGA
ncbi:biopolymer transport protein, ExbD/TolR family [Plesiocystis pacifica SIR-1]|uniref:Biopolymer transport protein, ExbD/TolR family n=1 Tax=Plesiocystis pacifica SIR-1 TaxID=391625 RepID=A6G4S1_9BACT|nr:biopolymer transporter ExbD [Plesiocystis pacifica]EDM79191.1 biopolymer transport protein, ExbD/TolR family [Plesiocystis pacifica SIR-1]